MEAPGPGGGLDAGEPGATAQSQGENYAEPLKHHIVEYCIHCITMVRERVTEGMGGRSQGKV